MTAYSFAFFWGVLILASFLGWGALVNRAALGAVRMDWGLRAGWGLAFTIFAGAFFNLFGVISRTLLIAWVAGGALVFAGVVFLGRARLAAQTGRVFASLRRDSVLTVLAILFFGLAFVQYAGSVRGRPFHGFTASLPYFNNHDDYQAYFVFPREMVDTGAISRDPYNVRRIVSSLGGQYYLDALVLSVLPEQSLHLADPGLGTLVTIALLFGLLTRLRAPPRLIVAVSALPLLLVPPVGNVSSLMVAFALFLTLARTLVLFESEGRLAKITLVALAAAALASTKNSVLPAAVAFLGAWYLLGSRQPRRRRFLEGTGVLVATTALVVPWLISLHQSSGTFLYPVLGQGDLGTRYGTFYSAADWLTPRHLVHLTAATATSAPIVAIVFLLAASWILLSPSDELVRAARALGLAALVGSFAVLLTVGFSVDRFSYPFVTAALTVLILTLVVSTANRGGSYACRIGAATLATGFVVGASWQETKTIYRELLKGAATAIKSEPLVKSDERAAYRAMQRSVPRGAPLLTRVEEPFLLDFKRNRVFVVDWPGGASPPPGMPLYHGAEALAGYLRQHGIRYIAYSYAAEGGFPRSDFSARLHDEPNSFNRVSAANAFAFQDLVRDLGTTRRRVYDDHRNFVLDLSMRTS